MKVCNVYRNTNILRGNVRFFVVVAYNENTNASEFISVGLKMVEEYGLRIRIWLSNKPYFVTAEANDVEV